MAIGIFGNSLVLYIFKFRYKPSNHRYFILSLATFDLLFDLFGIPFMIVEMRLNYIFPSEAACKLHRLINYSYGCGSGLTVMTIAVDRYLKVCKPNGRQITNKMAKGLCFVLAFIGILFALPAVELYGEHNVQRKQNITITQCLPRNKYKENPLFPTLYNGFLALCFITTVVTISICYTLIVRRVKTHKVTREMTFRSTISTTISTRSLHSSEDPSSTSNQAIFTQEGTSKKNSTRLKATVKTHRVAKMLFVVTAVFIVSYIPYFCLIITIYANANTNFKEDWSKTGEAFFEVFWRSFLINSFTNPIIYGFMDKKFRVECKTLLNRFINRG
ncbi:hypothetical protein CHS0354_025196 [Potamilus streckersoni]|uniref:G-protein coupled receptors family 1 profile domain-containing protein n=1 Tax=Potamilus streckersoni TaxID=2493646 RepID=A0AAE0VH25_9BIVA|nr:hypothetical protein CHS0354_025196 [Potamilus streckersoni]